MIDDERAGWRWRELRRAAICECAVANLDVPGAVEELRDPRAGHLTPTSSPWYAVRLDAIRRAALGVIGDPLADVEDRGCSASARLALSDPHADNADSAIYGPNGLDQLSLEGQIAVLGDLEAELSRRGEDTSDLRSTLTSGGLRPYRSGSLI